MLLTVVVDCAEIEQALRNPGASVTDLVVGYLQERGRAESALASKQIHHWNFRVSLDHISFL